MEFYSLSLSHYIKSVILAFFIVVLPLLVFASNTSSLQGTVVDKNGAALANIEVYLFRQDCVCIRDCPDLNCNDKDDREKCCAPQKAETNNNGVFGFPNIRPGNYFVQVEDPKYNFFKTNVLVAVNQSASLKIVLKKKLAKSCGFFCQIKRSFKKVF